MKEGNGVDHFARITEELISLILSRFENLKHLCGYSLVSKRFALAIYVLKSVHLTLPSTTHSTESADEIFELLPKLADGTQIYFVGVHMSSQHLQFLTLESVGEIQQRWSHGGTLSRTTSFCALGVYWGQKGLARSVVGVCRSIQAWDLGFGDIVHFLPRDLAIMDSCRGLPLFEKMKQGKMEEGNGVDHFARIPEELLSLILSRFENLKHLCGYSLVSKRFALAIYELKSVHLTLPSTTHSTESANEICGLLPKVAGFTSEELSEFINSSPIKELGFFSFLRNFRELRSISLDFTCPRSICSSSLLKVWVKFSSGRAMMELFLELPAFVHEKASSSDESSSSDDEDSYAALTDTGMHAQSLFRCCCVWLLVLCLLRKCHPSLVSVTITNSEKEGRLFVSNINLLFRINKSNEAELCSLNQTLVGYPVDELDSDPGALDGDDVVTWEYTGDEKDFGALDGNDVVTLRDSLLEFLGKYGETFPYLSAFNYAETSSSFI
ncbi:hypothetical protein SASPL_135450 [Salvia splendens]|uniref:F-box domain-containing protein n=1 Tax=Salvia splendens TaxID=180675 RepID=A0A8X8X069_SALSN|nr:hypothetical protein SASPL_135450 [Salvia splendens]